MKTDEVLPRRNCSLARPSSDYSRAPTKEHLRLGWRHMVHRGRSCRTADELTGPSSVPLTTVYQSISASIFLPHHRIYAESVLVRCIFLRSVACKRPDACWWYVPTSAIVDVHLFRPACSPVVFGWPSVVSHWLVTVTDLLPLVLCLTEPSSLEPSSSLLHQPRTSCRTLSFTFFCRVSVSEVLSSPWFLGEGLVMKLGFWNLK